MWLKKYNISPEVGIPSQNSSLLEDNTGWLKKYANGGKVGNPLSKKKTTNYQSKPKKDYNNLKKV